MTNTDPTIEDLQRDLAQADAVAEQKSNFLATMSHEIRTPMQSIYGLLELIEHEHPTSDILSMVKTAKSSATGLLEILDDVLDFAKMDADKMSLDQFEIPLRTLARGINEALAVKIQGKNIELCDDIGEDVPFVIMGDPKRLRQVIINLMGNASKFTQEGRITIKISTDYQHIKPPEDGIGIRFEIMDTGIGMAQQVADTLFKPFTQADNSTSRKYGGTGLGLSICKKLVELMDGKIGVISKEGKGSTFWFEIPTLEVSTDVNILELPILDGISILSVEDHPQGAKEIVRSLQSMGATVESCPTYSEALELITHRPFDVAVIDQGLPDGLGLDLIKQIMEIRPFTGLVMYTVRDDTGLQHSLQSLGVTYLTKPASRIGLGEAIQDAASKVKKMSIQGPTKLLIAEDTESVRDVLQRQLQKLEMEATFVENGAEAIKAIESGSYGILLTDLHMPEMDGYEVIRKIREEDGEQNKHFPVIALTADIQMSHRQVYMSHGFDECLLKPVSLGQLQRLLMRWGLLENEKNMNSSTKVNHDHSPNEKNDSAINKDAIISQMGALDKDAIEMLHLFIQMTAPLLEKIQNAQKDLNLHNLGEAAHSLKGAARSACALQLGDYAADLQTASEFKNNDPELVEKIVEEFNRVKKEIESFKY